MRPLSRFIVLTILAGCSCFTVAAQNSAEFNIGYGVNVPLGFFRNYTTNVAAKGFTAGFAYPVTDQLRIGLSVEYNDYYQKFPREVYPQSDGSAISAVVSNSIQQLPVMLTANYTLIKGGHILPFVGAGAGVNFISYDQYLGEFDDPTSKVKWVLQGSAGVWIPLSKYSPTAIKVAANYNYAPFDFYGKNNLNSLGIQAGIRFAIR
jgi:opacity protein-like surface antigen